jgi:hypothetical protein
MSTPIRLLLSDIDGTLVRSDKSLSDPVIAAVQRLRAAGVAMSLISARPLTGLVHIARRLQLTGPLGTFNGGTIVNTDGTILSAEHVPPGVAAQALSLFETTPGVTPWVYADGRWYVTTADNRHVPRERLSAGVEPSIVDDLTPHLARADKVVGVSDDLDRLARLEADVARTFDGEATVARSQPYYLDVTALKANKADGARGIAAAMGVPLSALAVIGDGHNDMGMFAVAGLSIAMGQAAPEVQQAADAVTLSNDEDGVADAIIRLVLPAAAP